MKPFDIDGEKMNIYANIKQADGINKKVLIDSIKFEPLFVNTFEYKLDKIIDNNNVLLRLKKRLLVEYLLLYPEQIYNHINCKLTSKNKIRFIENKIKLLKEFSVDFDGTETCFGANKVFEMPCNGIIGKIKEFENNQNRNFDLSNDNFLDNFLNVANYCNKNNFENINKLLFSCPENDETLCTYICKPETNRLWECFLVLVYNKFLDYLELDLENEKNNNNDLNYSEVFPKEMELILRNIHKEFNNELFDNIDIINFLDLFKLNTQKKLSFKKDCIALFAILISNYEKCHNKKIGAFADWYHNSFGGNYAENKRKKLKRKSEYLEKINKFHKDNPPPEIKDI
jgi:hypothetical protein